ncbi:exodeoxyribonuclease V subunit alpha [Reinekea sp. G2M2-21]|uniref:exodeoxyribonuclease V subunit alpha n=1 Tax=Reinekea sp. G2M2-21 TaxID=2788942 RepID=UPI0018A9836A|nr:exodeoxyribonuclease V subunit alpha [Reinekea sp. G2M2-21]
MFNLKSPFQPIDCALADRICQWHQSDDALLWQTIAATSLALQQGHSCLNLTLCQHEPPFHQMELYGGENFPTAAQWYERLSAFNLDPSSNSPLILDDQRVYLRRYWQFESELVRFFKRQRQTTHDLTPAQIKKAKQLLMDYFPNSGQQPDHQKLAAINSLFGNLNIIVGGPGTGKTYTVTRIMALLASLSDHPLDIKLAAPTGKAAQRLGEAIREAKLQMNLDMLLTAVIPDDAQTIHRLLGVIPNHIQFRHHADNPIEADVLLIDEGSMVDLPLMTRLCRAIKPTTRLILLGDADQLPSVAAGSVLGDLVSRPHPGYSTDRAQAIHQLDSQFPVQTSSAPADHVSELIHSRRFDGQSGIGVLARDVIAGDYPSSWSRFAQFDDVTQIATDTLSEQVRHWIQQYYAAIASQPTLPEAFAQLKTFRILCAVKDGDFGVDHINEVIRKQLDRLRQPFYKGQPIMVTQNHYGLKLFNGDIGLVWPDGNGQLLAWFEAQDGYRPVALGRLPATETVYAMTIHKTQGSEFNHVAMVLPPIPQALITRELLYTGLTRAKRQFTLIADEKSWRHGVQTKVERWAGLAERLADQVNDCH